MSEPRARVVPLPVDEFALHGHLAISHSCIASSSTSGYSVMSDAAKLRTLIKAHEDDHAYPQYITHPHVHSDPDPEPEWSWE